MIENRLIAGLNRIKTLAGKPIEIRYYSKTTGSIYDDDLTLSQSGNSIWTSGVIFPLNEKSDLSLIEQGKISTNDLKLYITGSLSLGFETGSIVVTKIGIGSPPIYYKPLEPISKGYEAAGVSIYKKVYIEKIQGGSYIGES